MRKHISQIKIGDKYKHLPSGNIKIYNSDNDIPWEVVNPDNFYIFEKDGIILCEESQEVTKAFRNKNLEFYSCDFKDCSGGKPEWHIKDNALNNLYGYRFIGAHPTCKYLTNSGVSWIARKEPTKGYEWSDKYKIYINWNRYEMMVDGALFFNKVIKAVKINGCGYVENPIMHKYAKEIVTEPYTQIIQPYQFGHTESKATCLWIYGFPKLKDTNNVKHILKKLPKNEAQRLHNLPPSKNRDELRSKTYPGIAKAMAEQWGIILNSFEKTEHEIIKL